MIDTHSHIYDEAFAEDLDQVVQRAREVGITQTVLPAIDSQSHDALINTVRKYPDFCIPTMGLHPTSVNENPNFRDELQLVANYLSNPPEGIKFCAIGEIGLDLYWNKDYEKEQIEAFEFQVELALLHDIPIIVHTREAWAQMISILKVYSGRGLRGVMHSFSGSVEDYREICQYGEFYFGIGGPLTYKKSSLAEVIKQIPLSQILTETDSPYLPPTPFRGKRNEPSYIIYIRDMIAQIKEHSPLEIDRITVENARKLFSIA